MQKAALLSVSDRSGMDVFARKLTELGYTLLTTSGTGKFLKEHGIESTSIEVYTGQAEIMDGRVKTLHPKIYAGLLARRDHPQDLDELKRNNIMPIDVAAVNLYPFSQSVGQGKSDGQMIELIDIGGPSMIRAAAKNHPFVFPVVDPNDYPAVLDALAGREQPGLRRALAVKVFSHLAQDNLEVASFFSQEKPSSAAPAQPRPLSSFSPVTGTVLEQEQTLRYGENPHQGACYYRFKGSKPAFKQLHGKELSYNNLLDADAAVKLVRDLSSARPTAVIIKHLNPCGVATAGSLREAVARAKRCDPRSHFGGILAFNQEVDSETAVNIREDFAEIVVAPSFSAPALDILRSNKALRLLAVPADAALTPIDCRVSLGGLLIQERDRRPTTITEATRVAGPELSADAREDLELAWCVCSHVKSNAIVLAKDGMLLGTGAGQMSRVDSVELAIKKAQSHGHDTKGAVAASDAFFPFPDGLEFLIQAGVTAVVAPKGAKRDEEVAAIAQKAGVTLLFTEERHFRH